MGTRVSRPGPGPGFGTAPRFSNKNIDQTPGPGTYNSKPQSTSPKFKFPKAPRFKNEPTTRQRSASAPISTDTQGQKLADNAHVERSSLPELSVSTTRGENSTMLLIRAEPRESSNATPLSELPASSNIISNSRPPSSDETPLSELTNFNGEFSSFLDGNQIGTRVDFLKSDQFVDSIRDDGFSHNLWGKAKRLKHGLTKKFWDSTLETPQQKLQKALKDKTNSDPKSIQDTYNSWTKQLGKEQLGERKNTYVFSNKSDVETGKDFKRKFNNSFQKFLVVEQMKKVIDESESESLSTTEKSNFKEMIKKLNISKNTEDAPIEQEGIELPSTHTNEDKYKDGYTTTLNYLLGEGNEPEVNIKYLYTECGNNDLFCGKDQEAIDNLNKSLIDINKIDKLDNEQKLTKILVKKLQNKTNKIKNEIQTSRTGIVALKEFAPDDVRINADDTITFNINVNEETKSITIKQDGTITNNDNTPITFEDLKTINTELKERGFVAKKTFETQKKAAVNIQRIRRGFVAKKKFETQKKAAVTIQKIGRGFVAKKKFEQRVEIQQTSQTLQQLKDFLPANAQINDEGTITFDINTGNQNQTTITIKNDGTIEDNNITLQDLKTINKELNQIKDITEQTQAAVTIQRIGKGIVARKKFNQRLEIKHSLKTLSKVTPTFTPETIKMGDTTYTKTNDNTYQNDDNTITLNVTTGNITTDNNVSLSELKKINEGLNKAIETTKDNLKTDIKLQTSESTSQCNSSDRMISELQTSEKINVRSSILDEISINDATTTQIKEHNKTVDDLNKETVESIKTQTKANETIQSQLNQASNLPEDNIDDLVYKQTALTQTKQAAGKLNSDILESKEVHNKKINTHKKQEEKILISIIDAQYEQLGEGAQESQKYHLEGNHFEGTIKILDKKIKRQKIKNELEIKQSLNTLAKLDYPQTEIKIEAKTLLTDLKSINKELKETVEKTAATKINKFGKSIIVQKRTTEKDISDTCKILNSLKEFIPEEMEGLNVKLTNESTLQVNVNNKTFEIDTSTGEITSDTKDFRLNELKEIHSELNQCVKLAIPLKQAKQLGAITLQKMGRGFLTRKKFIERKEIQKTTQTINELRSFLPDNATLNFDENIDETTGKLTEENLSLQKLRDINKNLKQISLETEFNEAQVSTLSSYIQEAGTFEECNKLETKIQGLNIPESHKNELIDQIILQKIECKKTDIEIHHSTRLPGLEPYKLEFEAQNTQFETQGAIEDQSKDLLSKADNQQKIQELLDQFEAGNLNRPDLEKLLEQKGLNEIPLETLLTGETPPEIIDKIGVLCVIIQQTLSIGKELDNQILNLCKDLLLSFELTETNAMKTLSEHYKSEDTKDKEHIFGTFLLKVLEYKNDENAVKRLLTTEITNTSNKLQDKGTHLKQYIESNFEGYKERSRSIPDAPERRTESAEARKIEKLNEKMNRILGETESTSFKEDMQAFLDTLLDDKLSAITQNIMKEEAKELRELSQKI